VVAAVTAARIAALASDRTDLFVDESQYWLWGQSLDLGYYSKPPLIAWLIRGVTELLGSDAPFVVRLPGAILHGAAALIVGAVAARLLDARHAGRTGPVRDDRARVPVLLPGRRRLRALPGARRRERQARRRRRAEDAARRPLADEGRRDVVGARLADGVRH